MFGQKHVCCNCVILRVMLQLSGFYLSVGFSVHSYVYLSVVVYSIRMSANFLLVHAMLSNFFISNLIIKDLCEKYKEITIDTIPYSFPLHPALPTCLNIHYSIAISVPKGLQLPSIQKKVQSLPKCIQLQNQRRWKRYYSRVTANCGVLASK
jgi:hypothetical protein